MSLIRLHWMAALGLVCCAAAPLAQAGDIHIHIPEPSKLTPVQRLNRDGVTAVEKHAYEKAEALFYKAYLYDPADPFTLNNLGYISELEGQIERAQSFYKLAAEQGCGAIIDRSDVKSLRGKPMAYALDTLQNTPMRINRLNLRGLALLSEDRGFAAEGVLQEALKLDPQNPFTLNNLGVAAEAVGDFDGALKYYDAAAESGSKEPIVVTLNKKARGKPVSQVAAQSAAQLRKRMRNMNLDQERATMLELRGVFEVNENDWDDAKKDFLEAYRLNPYSAFTLNNLGYVAEKNGDLETAQFFYDRARKASDAGARVGLATQITAQGANLGAVARDSTRNVDAELQVYSEERRGTPGPIELTPRYGTSQPDTAPANPNSNTQTPQAQQPQ